MNAVAGQSQYEISRYSCQDCQISDSEILKWTHFDWEIMNYSFVFRVDNSSSILALSLQQVSLHRTLSLPGWHQQWEGGQEWGIQNQPDGSGELCDGQVDWGDNHYSKVTRILKTELIISTTVIPLTLAGITLVKISLLSLSKSSTCTRRTGLDSRLWTPKVVFNSLIWLEITCSFSGSSSLIKLSFHTYSKYLFLKEHQSYEAWETHFKVCWSLHSYIIEKYKKYSSNSPSNLSNYLIKAELLSGDKWLEMEFYLGLEINRRPFIEKQIKRKMY